MGQIWLRSDGRVEKKGGYRQTDRQTDRQRFLQLYIVDRSVVVARLAAEFIASWLLLAAKVRKMLARPARRRITYEVVDEVFDNNPNYSVTDSV